MKIIIIGGGWYGCYSAFLLQKNHQVTLVEKNNDIFDNSSYYNQNRLHLGFHYPRNSKTRNLCQKYFNKFKNTFNSTYQVDNNYYLISNRSLIDYNTYLAVFKYEGFDLKEICNKSFQNIEGNCLSVNEEIIDSDLSKQFFKSNLNCEIILNHNVSNINIDSKPILCINNKQLECDLIIDCTYNLLNLSSKNYIYEKTISLLYKKINDVEFGGITIVDGNFVSLYPRDIKNNIYTLTDVEFTPLIKTSNLVEINNYKINDDQILEIIHNMENKLLEYYPDFKESFIYDGYFLANKTKLISNSDSRECNIEYIDNKLITVNCGKIIGIFELEEFYSNINLI